MFPYCLTSSERLNNLQVVLHSKENCGKCEIIKRKLSEKGIKYNEVYGDTKKLIKAGFMAYPVLEVNGKMMGFQDAIKWTNSEVVE